DLAELPALSPDDVEALLADGGTVVDARPIDRFAAGHVPNSLSVEMRSQFGTWLGWLVEPDVPIAIVVDEGQDVTELLWQMLNVGFEMPVGRLAGGVSAWGAAGLPVATTPLVSASGVNPDKMIVDVRQLSEWNIDHLDAATHIELGDIAARASQLSGEIQVHCGHGQRAMTAASLLEQAGLRDVTVTTGGPDDIKRAVAEAAAVR
ncbi:MAG: rhodanese-like domain-containing protein, partial [Acidimicrobiales bacterium]